MEMTLKVATGILVLCTLVSCSSNNQKQSKSLKPKNYMQPTEPGANPATVETNQEERTITSKIGGPVGYSMDRYDNSQVFQALEHNPTNSPSKWTNAAIGAAYTIVPVSEMIKVGKNKSCKNYRVTVMMTGQTKKHYGTACQMQDDTWKEVRLR